MKREPDKNPHKRGPSLQRGATAIEYALMGMLIAVVIVAAVGLLGARTLNMYELVRDAFP